VDHYTAVRYNGTMAVDGWAVTFDSARRAPSLLLAVPNVTAHPSTADVGLPTSYYSMWHYYVYTLKA